MRVQREEYGYSVHASHNRGANRHVLDIRKDGKGSFPWCLYRAKGTFEAHSKSYKGIKAKAASLISNWNME